MTHHCRFCGATLDEEEEERMDRYDFPVCHDCMHHGLTLLQRVLKKMKHERAVKDDGQDAA